MHQSIYQLPNCLKCKFFAKIKCIHRTNESAYEVTPREINLEFCSNIITKKIHLCTTLFMSCRHHLRTKFLAHPLGWTWTGLKPRQTTVSRPSTTPLSRKDHSRMFISNHRIGDRARTDSALLPKLQAFLFC